MLLTALVTTSRRNCSILESSTCRNDLAKGGKTLDDSLWNPPVVPRAAGSKDTRHSGSKYNGMTMIMITEIQLWLCNLRCLCRLL